MKIKCGDCFKCILIGCSCVGLLSSLEQPSLRAAATTTKKMTFCFNFQLIICGSCGKVLSSPLKRQSTSIKDWKLEPWRGEEKHRPGGKASCNVLFRACTLSLLPFESAQNYLHLRGNWTAHQSISKSQIFCDSSLVRSPRLPLVPPLVSHPDSDKLLLCWARLKIKSI